MDSGYMRFLQRHVRYEVQQINRNTKNELIVPQVYPYIIPQVDISPKIDVLPFHLKRIL